MTDFITNTIHSMQGFIQKKMLGGGGGGGGGGTSIGFGYNN